MYTSIHWKGDGTMFPAEFKSADEELAEMMVALRPKAVVYSPVVCRECGGRTVEVSPKTRTLGRDDRRHVGTPWLVATSYRFWCDACEVVTWRQSH